MATPIPTHRVTTYTHARRYSPTEVFFIIAGHRVVLPAWAARSLAQSLLRGAARVDPAWRSSPRDEQ